MAELEKLGPKFRIALRLAKDPRFRRLTCTHSGTYADDCLCLRAQEVRLFGGRRADAWLRGRRPSSRHRLPFLVPAPLLHCGHLRPGP